MSTSSTLPVYAGTLPGVPNAQLTEFSPLACWGRQGGRQAPLEHPPVAVFSAWSARSQAAAGGKRARGPSRSGGVGSSDLTIRHFFGTKPQ